MKRIKAMIESAFRKIDAINALDQWRLFGQITEEQYQKGRKLITKTFSK